MVNYYKKYLKYKKKYLMEKKKFLGGSENDMVDDPKYSKSPRPKSGFKRKQEGEKEESKQKEAKLEQGMDVIEVTTEAPAAAALNASSQQLLPATSPMLSLPPSEEVAKYESPYSQNSGYNAPPSPHVVELKHGMTVKEVTMEKAESPKFMNDSEESGSEESGSEEIGSDDEMSWRELNETEQPDEDYTSDFSQYEHSQTNEHIEKHGSTPPEEYEEPPEDRGIEFGGHDRPHAPPPSEREELHRFFDLIQVFHNDKIFAQVKPVAERKARMKQMTEYIYKIDMNSYGLTKGYYRLVDKGDNRYECEKMLNISDLTAELETKKEELQTELMDVSDVTKRENLNIKIQSLKEEIESNKIVSHSEYSTKNKITGEIVRFIPSGEKFLDINIPEGSLNEENLYLYYPLEEINRLLHHMLEEGYIEFPDKCDEKLDQYRTLGCWAKRYLKEGTSKLPKIGTTSVRDYEVSELVCALFFAGLAANREGKLIEIDHTQQDLWDTLLSLNDMDEDKKFFDTLTLLTKRLIKLDLLDCAENEDKYIEDGRKKKDSIKKHLGILFKELGEGTFDEYKPKIFKVYLSGKSITNEDVKKNTDTNPKNEKSDTHVTQRLVTGKVVMLLGISSKRTVGAPKSNYSNEIIWARDLKKNNKMLPYFRKMTLTQHLNLVKQKVDKGNATVSEGKWEITDWDKNVVWTVVKMKLPEYVEAWNNEFAELPDVKKRCRIHPSTLIIAAGEEFFTYKNFAEILGNGSHQQKELLRDAAKMCWSKEMHYELGSFDPKGSPDYTKHPGLSSKQLEKLYTDGHNAETNPSLHYYKVVKMIMTAEAKEIGKILANALFGKNTTYPVFEIDGENFVRLNNVDIVYDKIRLEPGDSAKYQDNAKLFFKIAIPIKQGDTEKWKCYSIEIRFKGNQGFSGAPQLLMMEANCRETFGFDENSPHNITGI